MPSHASLLTGLYPSQHGVGVRRPTVLSETSFRTLAEALRDRGYRTAAFSVNLFGFTRTNGFHRGFIRFEDYFQSIEDMAVRPIYGRAIERLMFRQLGFEDFPPGGERPTSTAHSCAGSSAMGTGRSSPS